MGNFHQLVRRFVFGAQQVISGSFNRSHEHEVTRTCLTSVQGLKSLVGAPGQRCCDSYQHCLEQDTRGEQLRPLVERMHSHGQIRLASLCETA